MASPSPPLPRDDGSALVVGGPTTVLDLGGLRIVSEPTFDAPGPHGYLTKTHGPVLADVDLALVSHDNLDDQGRAFAPAAPLLLTTTSGAERLGAPDKGLAAWDTHPLTRPDGGELTVTAAPAVHGPEDGERDAPGQPGQRPCRRDPRRSRQHPRPLRRLGPLHRRP